METSGNTRASWIEFCWERNGGVVYSVCSDLRVSTKVHGRGFLGFSENSHVLSYRFSHGDASRASEHKDGRPEVWSRQQKNAGRCLVPRTRLIGCPDDGWDFVVCYRITI
jgi:hypothetical protein